VTKASTICARGCNHRRQRLLYLQVLALWLGVDVPPEARADVYRGVVLLRDLSNPDPDSHPDPIPNSDPDPNSDPNPNPNQVLLRDLSTPGAIAAPAEEVAVELEVSWP